MEDSLIEILKKHNISDELIANVIESGYFIRDWVDPFSGKTWKSVSDKLYGSKGISSNIEIEKFIKYIKGQEVFFDSYPYVTFKVNSFNEILEILNDGRRKKFIEAGKMSFRGQSREHLISRKIPNPIRKNNEGKELSIPPGIYRNKSLGQSDLYEFDNEKTFLPFVKHLEPSFRDSVFDSQNSYDIMRVEQHYATQTPGLDVTFEILSALFFATNKYEKLEAGKATYTKVKKGYHQGCIYCFVFTDPPVKKSEYYIDKFDLFKTYIPERILRQSCGLPLFSEYERNIAVTDIDCIIYLDKDFDFDAGLSYEYMFPSKKEDSFYRKLLELKTKFPKQLNNVVEFVY